MKPRRQLGKAEQEGFIIYVAEEHYGTKADLRHGPLVNLWSDLFNLLFGLEL